MELVTRNYLWPRVTRDVGKYIDGYNLCQKIKNRTEAPVGKLNLSKILEKPWTHLIVDLTTKLLLIAGKDAILVVCIQDDTFCGNNGGNISREISKTV